MEYKSLREFQESCGYEIDGQWYPRVTSIVSVIAKPALYKYYAKQESFEAGENHKNKSAEEGTMIHAVIENIMEGKDIAVPSSVAAIVDSYKHFAQDTKIVPHKVETRIKSAKHGYAGTIDVLAEIDGKLGVLDIKTSSAIYRDYGIQTAAYVEALNEDLNMPELTRWVLRLDQTRACLGGCGARLRSRAGVDSIKNGFGRAKTCAHSWGPLTGDVELRELDNLQNDTKAFLAAKSLWEWQNDPWLCKIVQ